MVLEASWQNLKTEPIVSPNLQGMQFVMFLITNVNPTKLVGACYLVGNLYVWTKSGTAVEYMHKTFFINKVKV